MASTAAKWFSGLVLGAASLALSWACLILLRADWAETPQAALAWTPRDPARLARLAEERFDQAQTEPEFAAATALAHQSLRLSAMETKALKVLALDADRRGERNRAAALMAVLGNRTRRDTQVQLWLFEHSLTSRNYDAAFAAAHAVLRRNPQLSDVIFSAILTSLEDPAALTPIVRRLSSPPLPEWRRGFLSALVKNEAGVGRARELFVLLNNSANPPTDQETGELVRKILEAGDYALARRTWLALSPPAAAAEAGGGLYDGAFRGAPGAPPFNWRTKDEAGSISEIGQAPGGRPALHVQYDASRAGQLTEQLLVLVPGAYRLTGEVSAPEGAAPVGLGWRLSCADDGEIVLGEAVQEAVGAVWRPFSVDFNVPPEACPSQWLRLSNRVQDRFETLDAWYASFAVRRLP